MADFEPTASLPNLRRRSQLLRELRQFFDEQGFWEVETPLLSSDTVVDAHLDPIPVYHAIDCAPSSASNPRWLQTSPELGMKRLVASGANAIYQITRAFRQGEIGERHNPEFTLLEWYRVGDGLDDGMRCLAALAERVLGRGPAELLTYRQAFEACLNINPHQASVDELRSAAEKAKLSIPASLLDAEPSPTTSMSEPHSADRSNTALRDEWLNLLLAERIEPELGTPRPLILYDYPASQAALAQTRDDGRYPVAERFELYVDGLEIANGYHELLDAEVLVNRQLTANQRRERQGKPALPTQNRLLSAMQHGLPDCTGVALGIDRLLMTVLGVTSIREVIAFPFDRA